MTQEAADVLQAIKFTGTSVRGGGPDSKPPGLPLPMLKAEPGTSAAAMQLPADLLVASTQLPITKLETGEGLGGL